VSGRMLDAVENGAILQYCADDATQALLVGQHTHTLALPRSLGPCLGGRLWLTKLRCRRLSFRAVGAGRQSGRRRERSQYPPSLPPSVPVSPSLSSLPAWTDRRPGRRQTHDHRAQRGAARRARNAPRADRTRQICPTLRLTAAFGPKRAGGPRRKTISARRKSASE